MCCPSRGPPNERQSFRDWNQQNTFGKCQTVSTIKRFYIYYWKVDAINAEKHNWHCKWINVSFLQAQEGYSRRQEPIQYTGKLGLTTATRIKWHSVLTIGSTNFWESSSLWKLHWSRSVKGRTLNGLQSSGVRGHVIGRYHHHLWFCRRASRPVRIVLI